MEPYLRLREPELAKEVEFLISPLLRIKPPQIQVALDMDADAKTICDIAVKAYAGGARIIEAGTPAIKRHGTDLLIPQLKEAIAKYREGRQIEEEPIIVADLKTMDVGHLEARIAFRSGADIVNVLAIGSINKINEALSEAIRRDKAITIDLIQCEDPISKIEYLTRELRGYEDWVMFCLHKGISEQIRARGIYEDKALIEEARKKAKGFIFSVAGGIKEGTVKDIVSHGVEVCVVGSAIYNSSDPEGTTRRILEEMRRSYRRLA